MAEKKHTLEDLRKPFTGDYPKAMYKVAPAGQGDLKSPAYERILTNEAGIAYRSAEKHNYTTCLAEDAKEEKELARDGWVDHPAKATAA